MTNILIYSIDFFQDFVHISQLCELKKELYQVQDENQALQNEKCLLQHYLQQAWEQLQTCQLEVYQLQQEMNEIIRRLEFSVATEEETNQRAAFTIEQLQQLIQHLENENENLSAQIKV